MKLKMVAGKTYACPSLLGNERVITRGEVFEIPDDKAAFLLDDQYTDASNNPHPYFTQVADDEPVTGSDGPADSQGQGEGEGSGDAPAKPAAKNAGRRRNS